MKESKLRELLDLWTDIAEDREVRILYNCYEYKIKDLFESYDGKKVYIDIEKLK